MSASFLDVFKPRYPEAVFRLKNSLIALVFLVTATHLLPLPTLYSALWKFYRGSYASTWEKGAANVEVFIFSALLANILQSLIAIQSPPKSNPPPPSPATRFAPRQPATPTPSWRRAPNGLSPNTTPQRQKPFSPAASASDPRGLAKSYSLSFPPPSPDASFNSSASLSMSSPSPSSPLAAYRGRRGVGAGRALDESLLTRLQEAQSDDDDD
ncbi:hypothetical protein OF83DRAFT_1177234 [Amylostereum chailletii]|nr:hypothetical protein OF83DRAFT_1177234 [Amylostereum chailletii]